MLTNANVVSCQNVYRGGLLPSVCFHWRSHQMIIISSGLFSIDLCKRFNCGCVWHLFSRLCADRRFQDLSVVCDYICQDSVPVCRALNSEIGWVREWLPKIDSWTVMLIATSPQCDVKLSFSKSTAWSRPFTVACAGFHAAAMPITSQYPPSIAMLMLQLLSQCTWCNSNLNWVLHLREIKMLQTSLKEGLLR